MNTTKIYDAQLNVSKFYNDESINSLISMLSFIGDETYYNTKTNTIDIKCNRYASIEDDIKIKQIIKDWLLSLPAESKYINTMIDNIDIIFNITKLGYPNLEKHIINIYLY